MLSLTKPYQFISAVLRMTVLVHVWVAAAVENRITLLSDFVCLYSVYLGTRI